MRALLSVTDKTGIADFGRALADRGFELVSTGGTAKALREAGLDVRDVSDVTGFPEMLDGRVKTLHPMVHGGLLGDVRLSDHTQQMVAAGIVPIRLLVVNLYAFEKTVTGPHTFDEAIESIDIGGPAMIRAAAKNHANVAVVVDPNDYERVLTALDEGHLAELQTSLAAKAFRHTAYYDSMIARWLTGQSGESPLTDTYTLGLRRRQEFRYGENPHQAGALYTDPLDSAGIAQSIQLWGKDLSYNNINDAQGAWELVADLPSGSCAIIKHGNPCGAANTGDLAESYRQARASDPVSAFGGIAAFNGAVDESAALAMTEKGNFLEVVIAEEFTEEARRIFAERSGWGQDVRLLSAPMPAAAHSIQVKSVRGGAIVQTSDEEPTTNWTVATDRAPTDEQMAALQFLWRIVPHVKSNAIVVGSSSRLLGVGAGQMNRVQSVRLALEQAGDGARGAALASDAFFPFPDSIHTAADAGIVAIIQPGGSKKDPNVIAAANERGVAMVLTGVRHFLH
ncbi:MAG: bifunctional phosphoribosylaminoimidazolecarboxamide formyltransferase/IMP cyclohydrolase [Methanoregulaceae archaeon]|nr:bifunctional phosphoribosylaminoimidazolecarboxamide formyltransferase/IMP cyclohydrolase [Methanoregulaceae archaeon]